ncbi:hypothetical protein SHIRM173S_05742 [Streptomyces hirsutus]
MFSIVKPIIAMKCMVHMPDPMAPEPRASQPGRHDPVTASGRVAHRSPRAPPRQAMRKATVGVTRP